jgi:hypothetical protein
MIFAMGSLYGMQEETGKDVTCDSLSQPFSLEHFSSFMIEK